MDNRRKGYLPAVYVDIASGILSAPIGMGCKHGATRSGKHSFFAAWVIQFHMSLTSPCGSLDEAIHTCCSGSFHYGHVMVRFLMYQADTQAMIEIELTYKRSFCVASISRTHPLASLTEQTH